MAIPAMWRNWPGLYGRLWAVTADAHPLAEPEPAPAAADTDEPAGGDPEQISG
jgi:hypothetical protein